MAAVPQGMHVDPASGLLLPDGTELARAIRTQRSRRQNGMWLLLAGADGGSGSRSM